MKSSFAAREIDSDLIQELGQLLAEQIGQSIEAISDEQILAYLEQLLAETPEEQTTTASVHTLFEQQVARVPDGVAVVVDRAVDGDSPTDGCEQITYAALNRQADQLARLLRQRGAGPDRLVSVYIERSLDLIVSVLAILKAGGAYVPLVPGHPPAYLGYILTHARPVIVLTVERLASKLPPHQATILCLDNLDRTEGDGAAQAVEVSPTAAAYVVYTPFKAIVVEHGGLYAQLQTLQKCFELTAADTLLHRSSLALAAAVWEILWPLSFGGRLVLTSEKRSPVPLGQAFAAQGISIVHVTPSELHTLLDICVDTGCLAALRQVLCSGEPLRSGTVKRFFAHATCALSYLYYLPEAAALVTVQDCTPTTSQALLPIGKSVSHLSVYVLDAYLQPMPVGVPGDLYVAGSGLARGYLGDPAATEQRFISNPFARGQRMVKTGDIARHLPSGTFELLPSSSRTVWYAGHHIDLDEIAAVILEDPSIEQAIVLARERSQAGMTLIAYVVPSGPFMVARLQAHVQTRLAPPLQPAAFVPLTGLPLTAAGRVDERTLADLPVYDVATIERWESVLDTLLGSEQAAMTIQHRVAPTPLLDASALLPAAIGIATDEAKRAPNWFYRKIWRQRNIPAQTGKLRSRTILILSTGEGLGEQLAARLSAAGKRCIVVQPGAQFGRLSSRRYQIDPTNPHEYHLLCSVLVAEALPDQIVHFWTCDEARGAIANLEELTRAQGRGIYSLLFLAQALAVRHSGTAPCHLFVVSYYVQATAPGEPVAYADAPVLGLLKTLPQELPWLHCRHIDLALDGTAHLEYLDHELGMAGGDREVAYRHGKRLVSYLEHVNFRRAQSSTLPFKPGGMYLLSGELSGIGVLIARYLLEHYRARLLLIGRTRLPEQSSWEQVQHEDDRIAEYVRNYLALRAVSSDLRYEAVDAGDLAGLSHAVARAQQDWQCGLDGIIQLAAEVAARPLIDETYDSMAQTLHAQITGAWQLYQLLEENPESSFIAFSSVNGFFGDASAGARAAAHAFLDCFVHYQRHQRGLRSYCYAWSIWEDSGSSRHYQGQDLSRPRGYATVSPNQGLCSLLIGLSHDQPQLLIGLNGNTARIRRFIDGACAPQQHLVAYLSSTVDPARIADLSAIIVEDAFDTPTPCAFTQIEALPRDANGAIDRTQLAALEHGLSLDVGLVAPRTPLEHQLITIWREVLGVEHIGIYSRFFELGGDSILAIQVTSRANRAGLRLSPEQVFRYQTIAELAGAAQSAGPIYAEQDLVTGPVPLTPTQHFFFEHHLPVPDQFNHAYLFEAGLEIDIERLETAVRQLVRHHDALRLSFVRMNDGWRQVVARPQDHVYCMDFDLSDVPETQQKAAIESISATLHTSLNLAAGPLLRLGVIRPRSDRPPLLLIIIHHLVVDGVSWQILLEDLQDAYEQLSPGKTIELPLKTTSFQYWAERLVEHGRSAEARQEADYWLSQHWPEDAGVPCDFHGANSEGSTSYVALNLEADATHLLLHNLPAAYHAELNDILLTAVIQALAGWTQKREHLVEIAHHGRRAIFGDVDLSRTVGWFSTLCPVLLNLGKVADPIEELGAIRGQLERIPDHGFGYRLLRHLSGDKSLAARLCAIPKPQVLHTYLGSFDHLFAPSSLLTLVDGGIGPIHHPAGTRMYQLVFNQLVVDGHLQLVLTYSDELHRRETIENLAHGYLNALRAFIYRGPGLV